MNENKAYRYQYYPPPESAGGWRYLLESGEIHSKSGFNPEQLDIVCRQQERLHGGDSWSIAVIRHGYLIRELHTFNVLKPTRFDIWSCTKSFTSLAWGILIDENRRNVNNGGGKIDLSSHIYDHIPQGHPLSDSRKKRITVGQVISMTSNIRGQKQGIAGMPTKICDGHYEYALGKCSNRYGDWVSELTGEPGSDWDYSDPGFAHLSIAFSNITGENISDFLNHRVLKHIGIQSMSWDIAGGSGSIGPFTNAHTGIHISSRELARVGYLLLKAGNWEGKQLIPKWWIELATRTSQDLNPNYGYGFWVNTNRTMWPKLPKDAFALLGYRSNRCYVIPSLDLVVVRVGTGPPTWDESVFIYNIVQALTDV